MVLNINPTRMELLNLKKRLILAQRGHKLLRDKQDELVRNFLILIKSWKNARKEIEKNLMETQKIFLQAYVSVPKHILDHAFASLDTRLDLSVSVRRITSVRLPEFKTEVQTNFLNYSFSDTNVFLDKTVSAYSKLIVDMVNLAQIEKSIMLLGEEIRKTRRRVNALEYVLIPNIEDTIKYITMKLEEFERGNLVRLMKIKEIVRAH